MYLSFSDIPGNHNLFLDYLYEFDNVKAFYKNNCRDKEEYFKIFQRIAESHTEFRESLTSILHEQYGSEKPSLKTQKNINSLASKKNASGCNRPAAGYNRRTALYIL